MRVSARSRRLRVLLSGGLAFVTLCAVAVQMNAQPLFAALNQDLARAVPPVADAAPGAGAERAAETPPAAGTPAEAPRAAEARPAGEVESPQAILALQRAVDQAAPPDSIRFQADSALLRRDSVAVVDKVAKLLREESQWRLRIEVRADASDGDQEWSGTLSARRANALRNQFVKRGLEPHVMTAAGYADSELEPTSSGVEPGEVVLRLEAGD